MLTALASGATLDRSRPRQQTVAGRPGERQSDAVEHRHCRRCAATRGVARSLTGAVDWGAGTYTSPVLLLPEVVIAGLGKMQRVPRFDANDNVVPVNIVNVSWSADHRLIDGITIGASVASCVPLPPSRVAARSVVFESVEAIHRRSEFNVARPQVKL